MGSRYFTLIFLLSLSIVLKAQLSQKNERQFSRSYNEGVEAVQNERYTDAVAAFTEALKFNPGSAKAFLNRGRSRAVKGSFDEALLDIDQALSVDPNLAEAHFYKAYFIFDTDTSGLVEDHLKTAIDLGFEHAEAYYFLGLNYLNNENEDKALINFNKAIELKDDYALVYHNRAGIKRNMGDYSGSLYDYKASVNYREHFPQAFCNMGSLKMVLGDYEGAIEDFTKSIEQDPDHYLAYNSRGYGFYQMGELEKAASDFKRALEIKLDFMEPKLNTACVLTKEGNYSEAIEIMDEVILENPEEGILYSNRGLIKEMNGDLIGACEDWSKALELGEESVEEYLKECN